MCDVDRRSPGHDLQALLTVPNTLTNQSSSKIHINKQIIGNVNRFFTPP